MRDPTVLAKRRSNELSKSLIGRIWIVGLVLMVLGIVVSAIGVAMGSSGLDANDTQNVQYFLNAVSRTSGGFLAISGLVVLSIGGLLQFVAWVLAMVAAAMLARWAWFVLLLVLGLIGLEFFVMLAYVIAGPSERDAPRVMTPA
jgi:hypothetical protein